jgi:hypothetical protein
MHAVLLLIFLDVSSTPFEVGTTFCSYSLNCWRKHSVSFLRLDVLCF